ncbi:MAG: SDR family oxidoreductase [Alphaproteobacteria bacterium]|jgi:NAD(P)-dependent dehydrogenase (short-subunit alcohol dehydrogenase family)
MSNQSAPAQAVVIGASGGIGAAVLAALTDHDEYAQSLGLNRSDLDLEDEASIAAAAERVAATPFATRLVIDATGFLHGGGQAPEKSLRELSLDKLARSFAVNAIGPALLMKHFLPLFPRDGKAVFATLSARVGSIGDNQLGGWYGYRASKAALNQLVRTAAVELRRSRPKAACVALHPGTVATPLSDPFTKSGLNVCAPEAAANDLLNVIDRLTPEMSGGFFDHNGHEIPW